MAILKNTEELKNELGSLIWRMATNLVHGGKVSPVQFMDYTLGALFYRFISENITDYCNKLMADAGVPNPDYANMNDATAENARDQIINAKGFFILPSQLFINVANGASKNTELNTTLANNFKAIEQSAIGKPSENDVKGLFSNFNTNDNGLGTTVGERNELLTTLLESVRDLNFTTYIESGLDVFGICYEHLIKMYALNSGTKGGEFYTPSEVSYLLAKIAAAGRKTVNKVYDPACGSGSLLLNFNLVLGAKNVEDGFYGQEINLKTYNLCRMNMFLHNVNYDHFDIQLGDTLRNPLHTDEEPFDAIVSNPPYSIPWDGDNDATLINDPRFAPAGVLAPRSKADFAFTMHMLSWLSAQGTAAIVEFPGILYRSGAEQKIRRKSANRVCFIDASNEFGHEGNKNKLTAENIDRIYNAYMSKEEDAHFCHVVTTADIESEDFNLSVSTYVEQEDTREKVDIKELNQRIAEIVAREQKLRTDIDTIVKELEGDVA